MTVPGYRPLLAIVFCWPVFAFAQANLASAPVRIDSSTQARAAEGVVEAVRSSVIAPQVAGVITQILVKPGDVVKSGQLLARIDARAAQQGADASGAQSEAARAAFDVARKEYERQTQLFAKQYISQGAMDRAEAQFKAAQAQFNASIASAGVARTQTQFFSLTAPYGGMVAEVPANVGDMAMPGQKLMTVYDPAALRVLATVPQESAQRLPADAVIKVELPGLAPEHRWQTAVHVTVLPTADPVTQTTQIRLDLPASTGATPGMFARAWLPFSDGAMKALQRLYIPQEALLRRAQMDVVYVIGEDGKPGLRQVRRGATHGSETEILAGLSAGERVAIDPIAAAKLR